MKRTRAPVIEFTGIVLGLSQQTVKLASLNEVVVLHHKGPWKERRDIASQ